MKSVLISIQPKWCELIASGKKTIEVRKTKPKLETPFKVYIYCTKNTFDIRYSDSAKHWQQNACGKVIGEFICDGITGGFWITPFADYLQKQSCLSYREVWDYSNRKPIFAWHISNLVIYDKPKELGEFMKCKYPFDCCACDYWDSIYLTCNKPIRPPQSWCYVESGATDTNVGDKSRGGNGNEKKP